MAAKHGLFYNKRLHVALISVAGLFGIPDVPGSTTNLEFGAWRRDTGNASIPDVTYNQASAIKLLDPTDPPTYNGTQLRPYVTRITASIIGPTAWTNGISVNLRDGNSNVVAGFPLVSLGAWSSFDFPYPANRVVVPLTVTGSSSTVTAINFASTPFVAKATNSLVGAFIRCTSTGADTAANLGLVRQVTDHTTGQLTVAALPVAPAANDTWEMYSHQGVATMSTTVVTANDALTTSTQIDNYVTLLTGAGAGQRRRVSANTSSALTVGTLAVTGDTTTTFGISDAPALLGASDFNNTTNHLPTVAVSGGLYLDVIGTMGAGSPMRFSVEGVYGV